MNSSLQLMEAVSDLLEFLRDPDVADEFSIQGGNVRAWKSDEFKELIRKAQEALSSFGPEGQ